MVSPSALHEAQVIGVIHNAGEIGVLVIDPDLHVMAAVADLAVEMCCHLRSPIAPEQWFCAKSLRRASLVACYETAGAAPPTVTSTISGGTPIRKGTMLQPRPPGT